ncbi:MAG: hypothetical protein CL471_06490 [Acidobacteria bacterium]|nr:hypothetical protein [Acidobacteriota bacterium]
MHDQPALVDRRRRDRHELHERLGRVRHGPLREPEPDLPGRRPAGADRVALRSGREPLRQDVRDAKRPRGGGLADRVPRQKPVTGGRRGAPARLTLAAACLLATAGTGSAQVTLEYIAHAAFVIEADGTRLVIDPYNGARWLGYEFPDGIEADAVAITHPHYDHDADYYLAGGRPTFREPGRYRVSETRSARWP